MVDLFTVFFFLKNGEKGLTMGVESFICQIVVSSPLILTLLTVFRRREF